MTIDVALITFPPTMQTFNSFTTLVCNETEPKLGFVCAEPLVWSSDEVLNLRKVWRIYFRRWYRSLQKCDAFTFGDKVYEMLPMELNVKKKRKKSAWWFWTCVWLFLLVGETVRVDRVPFLPCLDLLLLMVSTWSSTRWCPERGLSSEGSASDVSSAPELVSADLSGSAVIIFFFLIFRPRLLRWRSKTNANNPAARLGWSRRAKASNAAKALMGRARRAAVSSTLGTAPRLGGTGEFTCRCRVKGGSKRGSFQTAEPVEYLLFWLWAI